MLGKFTLQKRWNLLFTVGFGFLFSLTFSAVVDRLLLNQHLKERPSAMIHTITIQYQVTSDAMREIMRRLRYSSTDIHDFFWSKETISKKIDPDILGIESITLSNIYFYDHHERVSKRYYIVYINRMEPLSIITGEYHIKLFECSTGNMEALCRKFRDKIKSRFSIKGKDDPLYFLTDFTQWEAQRVDYTHDIKLNNHDEVLLFLNLAKIAVLSSTYNKQKDASTFGDHFYDSNFTYGNKTWEISIYDKQKQVRESSEKKRLYQDTTQRLTEESQGIARLEYRRQPAGTKTQATKYESRNIMEFMDEDRAQEWLHSCYGALIGYEDFCSKDYAIKALNAAYPMNESELKLERKREREAKANNTAYTPQLLSKKAQKFFDYMNNISSHKGINNYFNKELLTAGITISDDMSKEDKKEAQKASATIKARFKDYDRAIRSAGISPILIPHSWMYKKVNKHTGKALDIPHGVFKNPVQRPED